MKGYYEDSLSAERLRRVYEVAPPRVARYLEMEIRHVLDAVGRNATVLELGCGYGRVLARIAERARLAVGIDSSAASVALAKRELSDRANCRLLVMDASRLAFGGGLFDLVACVQNGISAFHVDGRLLVAEGVRVAKPGGLVLFSSYADSFWEDRLRWFRIQAREGLVGEIDEGRTGNGEIVCRDGFTATTVRPGRFRELAAECGLGARVVEIDQSSVFCEIRVPRRGR